MRLRKKLFSFFKNHKKESTHELVNSIVPDRFTNKFKDINESNEIQSIFFPERTNNKKLGIFLKLKRFNLSKFNKTFFYPYKKVIVSCIVIVATIFIGKSIITAFAASSPWTQTTWESGVGASTTNQYSAATNIDTSTSGQFTLDQSNAKIAVFKGSQLSSGSTNLSVASKTSIRYNTSQTYNDNIFTYAGGSPTRLTVDEDGDYFISLTMPLYSDGVEDSANRSGIEAEIRVNGVKVDVGVGRNSYIRNYTSNFDATLNHAVLLEDLSASDYVEIFVARTTSDTSHPITSNFTLYAEKIESTETIFSASATRTVAGTDLNSSQSSLQWTEGRKDSGYTHSDDTNSHQITLDDAGSYLVAVNVPLGGSSQRTNVEGNILLDGSEVPGSEFKQGYIRNASSHSDSSIFWSGVVRSTSSSQVLTVTTQSEAGSGTVTVDGEKATIFVQKLPSTGVYYGSATQAGGSNNWNPDSAENINWATDTVIDTDVYTHSTSTNNHQITVEEDGDYLLSVNAAFTSSVQRANPKIKALVNGSEVTGALTASSYIRSASGHNDSSTNMLIPLVGLSANDVISLTVVAEAVSGTVDDTSSATLVLVKKGLPSSGTLTSNIFDTETPSDWGTLTYNTSGSGSVSVKVRTDSNSDMSGATAWASCDAISSGSDLTDNNCVTDTDQYVQYQVTLTPSGFSTPTFEDISIPFSASDQVAPTTNASSIIMYVSNGGRDVPSDDVDGNWNNGTTPYFTWTAGADNGGGSGLLGYCLYLGTSSSGDPASSGGILQNSPTSTSGSTCGFITSTNSIDFSAGSYFSSALSSGTTYYLNVKAIDNGKNIFSGSSAQFKFRHDATAPTNVSYISTPNLVFGNVDDMSFTWPSGVGSASTDDDAGVIGWQYQVNATASDGWKGSTTSSELDVDYLPLSGSTYSFDLTDAEDGSAISEGTNTVYFRTVDSAGNFSSAATYRTAPLEYGGAAPTFSLACSAGTGVTVTPSTNTSNSYALSWDAAEAQGVTTISTYYYMVNSSPPSTLSTLESNSTLYIPNSTTSVSAKSLTGAVKGSNTVYVVAVDSDDNYSQSNCIKGTFTLNSSLPDAPKSLAASDSSIKSEEIWRASLSWSAPDYKGTGSLTYKIQRSTDNSTWSDIATTTGLSYTDTVDTSTTYYYRVGSYDTTNESTNNPTYTSSVSILPKGSYSTAATLSADPEASAITTKRATITWSTSRTSDSKVQYGTGSGDYFSEEPSTSDQVTSHSIKLTNLSPGTKYYYRAKWTDEDGNTGISDEQTFTTDPAPTVSDVTESSIGLDSVLINFTTENASTATIYYGKTTGYGGTTTTSTSTSKSEYSVRLNSLDDGTTYHYKLVLTDSEDEEYEFEDHQFDTLPRPEVSNIQIQQIAGAAQPTVFVTWESNTAISSIITYYPQGNTDAAIDEVNVALEEGEHRMVLRGLLPQTVYSMVVKGRDRVGNEAISDVYNFTTATDTRPPLIGGLKVEGRNVTVGSGSSKENVSQLVISWNTDEPGTSQVEYGEGTSTSYAQSTQEDSSLTFNHVVVISGLSPSKVYHLRAVSKDDAGNIGNSVDTVTITPKATESALDLVITNLSDAFGFLGNLRN